MSLENILLKNNIEFTKEQLEKLTIFKKEVIEKNKQFNLTSITEDEEFNVKHLLDSLMLFNFYDKQEFDNKSLLDIGTGAGIPGIPLAIFLTNTKFYLLDSTSKKITFIKETAKLLRLNNIFTINDRVELLKIEEGYDFAISRGFSSLATNFETISPILKKGGRMILYKTSKEIPSQKNERISLTEFGIKKHKINSFLLNDEFDRTFIDFVKVKPNKSKYPRVYSNIKNKPVF